VNELPTDPQRPKEMKNENFRDNKMHRELRAAVNALRPGPQIFAEF